MSKESINNLRLAGIMHVITASGMNNTMVAGFLSSILFFCDIGDEDALFIRALTGSNILVDGKSDDFVLNCLYKHMPFWDKKYN